MSHSTLGEVGTYFGGSRDCGRDDEVLLPNSVMEELRFAQNSCVTLQNRATHLRSQVALGEPAGAPTPFSFDLEPRNTVCRRTVIDLNC